MVIMGIILSVILGGVVIGVVNGIKEYYTSSIYEAGFNVIFVISGKTGVGGGFYPAAKPLIVSDVRELKNLPDIKAVSPLFIAGVFRFGDNVTYLIGADEDLSLSASLTLYKGRFVNSNDSSSQAIPVVLGYNIWQYFLNQSININSDLNLLLEPYSLTYGKGNPKSVELHVIGLLDKRAQVPGLGIDPNNVFFTDLVHAYKIFNVTDLSKAYVDGAVASTPSFQDLDNASNEIVSFLESKGYSEKTDFTVISQKDALRYIDRVFVQINNFINVIWAVVLTIGSLSVLIVMVITVRERYKEIGTLRSLGARRSDIMILFLLEASWLSILGIVLGSVIGIIVIEALKQYFEFIKFVTFPVILQTYAIILPEIFLFSLLFALYPAYRAARIDPVQALKYE